MSGLIGRMLGPYEIVDKIGHGGMADVYRAVQPSIGREVAIKVLPAHFLQDPSFLQRFTREVRVISRLQHPRILPVYDFGEQDGLPYIVMAYMSSGTLADLIKATPGGLSLGETARLIGQIAEGLDFAHEKGIIHRDLKPSNILLDEKTNAYLSDFGIAKVTEATAQLTGSGIVGTPAYMAPEMAGMGGVTPLVDVYALGVVLFQMLTGKYPYEADTPMGILMAHVAHPIPDPREIRPDLPDDTRYIVERALAKDPLDRYQSAGELAADLQVVADGGSLSIIPTPSEAAGGPTLIEQAPAPEEEKSTIIEPPAETVPVAKVGEPETVPAAPPEAPVAPPEAPAAPVELPAVQRPETQPTPPAVSTEPIAGAGPRKRRLSPIWFGVAGLVVVALIAVGALVILGGFPGGPEEPGPAEVFPPEGGGEEGPSGEAPGAAEEPTGGEEPAGAEIPAGLIDTSRDMLVVCMSEEPETLYVTGAYPSSASLTVLAAADPKGWTNDAAYSYQTLMLVNDEFPSFENGDVEFEGENLVVTFRFKDSIWWSDGAPFTVDDILFTREVLLASGSEEVDLSMLEQASFEKIDDFTLQVVYPPDTWDSRYFLPPLSTVYDLSPPLPEHVLGGMSPAEIAESDYARLPDPVLGPYRFVEWNRGESIVLEAVENWWGGEVIVPNLIFRFIGDGDRLLEALIDGECDYVASGLELEQLPFIQEAAGEGAIEYAAIPLPVWEHIDFNTWPVEPETERGGIPFFADAQVRQAIAYGTDRRRIIDEVLYGEGDPLNSYIPPGHWAYNPEVEGAYPYDPEMAVQLLEEAGWVDTDGDGIREAARTLSGEYSCGRGTWTIPAGTRFEVTLYSSISPMRDTLSAIFAENMHEIGIQVNATLLPAGEWFGEEGPLLRRTFQLGEFAWATEGDPAALEIYGGENVYRTPDGASLVAEFILADNPGLPEEAGISREEFLLGRPERLPEGYWLVYPEQIPSATDGYEGLNFPGWCDAEATQSAFEGDNALSPEERAPHYLNLQRILIEQLPSLPLFQRIKIEASQPGLCGPAPGPVSFATWNVEQWYFSRTGECE
ncbi:MAG TPA: hypothetical protein ENI95_09155 [Chloroflexi bacterium]|nr:hypothetical protein [Chloroflexota bacterium]